VSRILFSDGVIQFRTGVQIIPDGSTAADCVCCGPPAQVCDDLVCSSQNVQSINFVPDIPDPLIFWSLGLDDIWSRWSFGGTSSFNKTYNAIKIVPGSAGPCAYEVEETLSVSASETRYARLPGSICPDTSIGTAGVSTTGNVTFGAGVTLATLAPASSGPPPAFPLIIWTWGECSEGLQTTQNFNASASCGNDPPNDEIQILDCTKTLVF
jgi:hypothetical protein